MGRKKGKHRKPRPPKLSGLDRVIYGTVSALIWALFLVLFLAFVFIKKALALSDTNLIAYIESGSIFFAFPAWMYLFLSCIIFVINRWTDRKPIFGRKDVNYPPELWPMFTKQKRPQMYERPSHVRGRKMAWRIWWVGLALVLCLVPFSLFAKKTISADGEFCDYGVFGSKTQYDADEIKSLEIGWRKRTRPTYSFTPCMEFTMRDGTVFSIMLGSFRSEFTTKESLQYMLYLKSLVDEQEITYDSSLEKFLYLETQLLGKEERALLNILYDQEEAP